MAVCKLDENWQCNKSASQRHSIMLDRQINTDVTFIFPEGASKTSDHKDDTQCVQETKTVGAHKYMLESGSPVFWSMLNGQLAEKGEITITDVDHSIFTAVLRFIYTDDISLTGDTVLSVLYTSNKYIIPSLSQKCCEYLEDNLDVENVCQVFDKAITFDEGILVQHCMDFIQNRTAAVIETHHFKEMSSSSLQKLLQCDQLSASEVAIFQACVQWATNKCIGSKTDSSGDDVRKALGELLYSVRFPSMSPAEFATHVSPTGILSKDEELMIFRYIGNPGMLKESDCSFATKKRTPQSTLFQPVAFDELPQCYLKAQGSLLARYQLKKMEGDANVLGLRVVCKQNDIISATLQEIPQNVPKGRQPQTTFGIQVQIESRSNIINFIPVVDAKNAVNLMSMDAVCQDIQWLTSEQDVPAPTGNVLFSKSVVSTNTINGLTFADIFVKNKPVHIKCGAKYNLTLHLEYKMSSSSSDSQRQQFLSIGGKSLCLIGILLNRSQQ